MCVSIKWIIIQLWLIIVNICDSTPPRRGYTDSSLALTFLLIHSRHHSNGEQQAGLVLWSFLSDPSDLLLTFSFMTLSQPSGTLPHCQPNKSKNKLRQVKNMQFGLLMQLLWLRGNRRQLNSHSAVPPSDWGAERAFGDPVVTHRERNRVFIERMKPFNRPTAVGIVLPVIELRYN